MYFLGMMGIVQAAFLPGTLFVHLYRPKGGIIYKFSLVFASSLFINFILVHFLRLLSISRRSGILPYAGCSSRRMPTERFNPMWLTTWKMGPTNCFIRKITGLNIG
jgi:hypothetical protein